MSQRNAKQKSKRPMFQPPLLANSNSPPNPAPHSSSPPSPAPHSSSPPSLAQHSNPTSNSTSSPSSERTITASPTSNSNSSPSETKIKIYPVGTSFEPCRAHRKIIESITRIFPDAIKSYKDALRHMKDVWFNEFKKFCTWNPEDYAAIESIYHKRAPRRLSDALREVHIKLAYGDAKPDWMTDQVLAQYRIIWDSEDFKKTALKNKNNRNSDCGGLGPSLHTACSIPMTEHRRRMREKFGEEPSHAALFKTTHKRKKTDEFVCKKAQQVMDAVIQIKQTQPELGDSSGWYEAASGLKKRGCVFGFGSDTQHYFPEAVRQKNLKSRQSTAHAACDDKIKQLNEEKKQIMDKVQRLDSQMAALASANPQLFQSTFPNLHGAGSHESSGVGLDDLGLSDDTQFPFVAE